MGNTKYCGKYRGMVIGNDDPQKMGRLKVRVPDMQDDLPLGWASPCVPLADAHAGIYYLPQIGTNVWVEFEQGDLHRPIWSGGWWGEGEVPNLATGALPAQPQIVIQTSEQTSLTLSDVPGTSGGILLKTSSGAIIAINDEGITISNGKGATIVMNGTTVNINGEMVIP